MEKWVGKVAVVTGASAGIGKEIARSLAEKGVIVVGVARRAEMIKEWAAKEKLDVHAVKCDLSSEEEIVAAFSWVENNLGGVDVLINNAGVSPICHLATGSTEEWKSILNTNIMGLSICTREALKTMRHRGDDGQIIHISSVLGHYVPQYSSPLGMYSASKHAICVLTEALRVELQQLNSNIKVSCVSPGGTRTEMFTNNFGETFPLLDVEDVRDAILYVLSTKPRVQVQDIVLQVIGSKVYDG